MDSFSIIQNFFTRMRCDQCHQHLQPEGIQLMREEGGVFVVNVTCQLCDHHVGVAMVGLESAEGEAKTTRRRKRRTDPELTAKELKRFAKLDPIGYDDVLDAHHFFQNLDENWLKHVPEEMRRLKIKDDKESL